MKPQYLSWHDPLKMAQLIAQKANDKPLVFLHSAARTSYSGRFSLLACDIEERIELDNFDILEKIISYDQPQFSNCWFGYLGYEMRHDCENYQPSAAGIFSLPRGILMRFARIFVFDHDEKTLTLWSENKQKTAIAELKDIDNSELDNSYSDNSDSDHAELVKIISMSSNMTRAEYQQKLARIIEEIEAGNLYQANLTRKFYGEFANNPRGIDIFSRLCKISPAPYSAYLRLPEIEIISSSPELFLRIEQNGMVTTRPIKGTAPRGKTIATDNEYKQKLLASAKNRAENLMITDLMRNDLARVCAAGSVVAENLFEVTSHSSVHHLASTVKGKLIGNISQLLRASFPPGSMTGAPKIRATQLCAQLEGTAREIYSGALGWLGGNGSAELSVVIRTLLLKGNKFEFQVGGGIVADSSAEDEWKETIDKAMGIINTLGIERNVLENL